MSGILLVEVLLFDNVIEKFTTWAELHNYMDVAVVDIRFVEFDDVGMVIFQHNKKFVFHVRNFLFDRIFQNALDSDHILSVCFRASQTHSAEMASAEHL